MTESGQRNIEICIIACVHSEYALANPARSLLQLLQVTRCKRLFGFISVPYTPTLGTSSCKRPSRFCSIWLVQIVLPVAFPPGRLKLSTYPSLTGSTPVAQLLNPTTECKLATRLGTRNVPVTRTFALDLKAGARACLNPAGAAPLPPAPASRPCPIRGTSLSR